MIGLCPNSWSSAHRRRVNSSQKVSDIVGTWVISLHLQDLVSHVFRIADACIQWYSVLLGYHASFWHVSCAIFS